LETQSCNKQIGRDKRQSLWCGDLDNGTIGVRVCSGCQGCQFYS
jgi:hypothetical protein